MASNLTAGVAYVDLTVGKTDDLKKGVTASAKDAGEKGGSSFKESFMDTAKELVGPLAGLFAIDKIKDFVTEGIKGAEQAQQASRLTAQVIQSTGGAANVSAGQVDELSKSLSAKTAVDEETIRSGSNLMLTFTNVKNEAGKGNDVFNQSIGIANDMSKALGQDMKSSVMQLGKALNDPVKGMTALQRVGVSFTAQQKAQVKEMVASNNIMGAQKVVLAELNKEFGGAAAAMADPIQRVKVSTEELGKSIGALFLGPMKAGSTGIADLETKAISFFEHVQEKEADFGAKSKSAMDAVKAGWEASTPPPVGGVLSAFWHLGDSIKGIINTVKTDVQHVFSSFMEGMQIGGVSSLSAAFGSLKDVMAGLGPILNPFGLILKSLEPVLPQIAQMIGQVAAILMGGLGQAARLLLPVIGQMVNALSQVAVILVGALGQALQALLPAFPPLMQAISAIVGALAGGFVAVLNAITPLLPPIAQVLGSIAGAIGGALAQAVQVLVPVITPLVQVFMELLKGILPPLLPIISTLVSAIGQIFNAISPLIPIATLLFTSILKLALPIIQALTPVITLIANIIGSVLGGAINFVVPIIRFFISIVVSVADTLGRAFAGAADFISGAFNAIVGAIKGPINWIIGMINHVIDAIDSINIDTPFGHIGFSIPHIPQLAQGGIVNPSPGGTLVTVGEAGEAEAVIPLSKLNQMLNSQASISGGVTHNVSGPDITIYTQAVDPVSIAHVLENQLVHSARAL